VALHLALQSLVKAGKLDKIPLTGQVAAISCGVYKGTPVLDLDYVEDSDCEMDANFVLTEDGRIIEIQCTAEQEPVDEKEFRKLLALGRKGIKKLAAAQKKAIG